MRDRRGFHITVPSSHTKERPQLAHSKQQQPHSSSATNAGMDADKILTLARLLPKADSCTLHLCESAAADDITAFIQMLAK